MAELQGRNIEGVLFDADGTLIDTYDIILRSMDHVLNGMHGFGLTDAELMAGVGTPLRDQMRGFARGDEALAAELSEAYRLHNDAIHDEGIGAFPDTRAALERLAAAGFRMGVVTSKRHEMAALGLELSGISSFFDVLIGYDDFPECKPLPGPVLHGCERLGLPPSACLYVGDSPFDMQAGNAAGCLTVAALWGMFPREALAAESPALECASLTQLADLLGA